MNTKAASRSFLAVFLSVLMVTFTMVPMSLADTMDPAFDPTTGSEYVATDPASPFASGSGTQEDPYIIESAQQLAAFRDSVNKGFNFYKGSHIKLAADIDLGGTPWVPIGKAQRKGSGVTGTSSTFQGTFDGDGHTISGLAINSTSNADAPVGLFGAVVGGTIKSLVIANANVDVPDSEIAAAAVGMLTGGGTVSGVTVGGLVSAKCAAGGMVGRMTLEGTVSDCTNNATVTTSGGSGNTGGIVGAAYYTSTSGKMLIKNCKNTAVISGTNDVGGIVGLDCGFVSNCENSGAVSGTSYSLGGIAGECKCYGGVTGSANTANVTFTGTDEKAFGFGGIVGWVRYDGAAPAYAACEPIFVTDNTNSGSIKGADDAGGIVGTAYNAVTVTGNENGAKAIESDNFAAGIVGNIQIAKGQNPAAGFVITVENNVSTTPLDAMASPLKDLYAYNNPGADAATVKDNATSWAASNGEERYTSLPNAIADAKDGDEVLLSNDLANQSTVTKSGAGTVRLDLNGHNLAFAPMSEFVITDGTLVVDGTGDVSLGDDQGAESPENDELFTMKPASILASPKALVEGGVYNTDVSKFVAPEYAELAKGAPSDATTFAVMPQKDAKDKAKAEVTKNGTTIYYENADTAKAAAADDPNASLKVYDQSDPSDNPGDNPGGNTPGDNSSDNPGSDTPGDNPDGNTPGDNPSDNPNTPGSGDNPGSNTPGDNPGGDADSKPNTPTPGDNPGNGDAQGSSSIHAGDDGTGSADNTTADTNTTGPVRGTADQGHAKDAGISLANNSAAPQTDDLLPAGIIVLVTLLLAAAVIVGASASSSENKGKHSVGK